MRVVLQRVKSGAVSIAGVEHNSIESGYVLLIGFTHEDDQTAIKKMADKILGLRLFSDNEGKMNIALDKTTQAILAISQFTLYADVKKGKRPSFSQSMPGSTAEGLYDYFCSYCAEQGYQIKRGVFGADMEVSLINDGPVTLMLDSTQL